MTGGQHAQPRRGIIAKLILFTGIVAAIVTAVLLTRAVSASAQSQPLVYVCQQQPCTNAQEFEVFDGNGNPVFSVPEYGGPAVFGDNFSVYAPGSVYYPSFVFSYTSPAAYLAQHPGDTQAAKCEAPAVWEAPSDTGVDVWRCASGAWVQTSGAAVLPFEGVRS